MDSKFHIGAHKLIVGPAMYFYISHYFWLVLAAQMFFRAKLNMWWNVVLLYVTTETLVLLSYLFLKNMSALILEKVCGIKKNKKKHGQIDNIDTCNDQ